jgi:hypothetical protein
MTKGIWGLAGSLAIGVMGAGASLSEGAAINYGDFFASDYAFLSVIESSGTDAVPLYGAPSVFNNGLDFNPQFTSTVTSGAADITDGQLNFTIDGSIGNTNNAIEKIIVKEGGDYTLIGAGTPVTEVFAGIILRATITELNGVSIAPITLAAVSTTFSDSLPGAELVAAWDLELQIDIQAALINLGYSSDVKATAVDVSINDTLASVSEPSTAAFIAKKEFIVEVNPIPEPGTAALLSLGGMSMLMRRRRRFC